jgi:hypothetical protein
MKIESSGKRNDGQGDASLIVIAIIAALRFPPILGTRRSGAPLIFKCVRMAMSCSSSDEIYEYDGDVLSRIIGAFWSCRHSH